MPCLAAVLAFISPRLALVAVWLIPAIAVPSDLGIVAFAFLGVAVLVPSRAETRPARRPTTV